jgi:hypothetical protein
LNGAGQAELLILKRNGLNEAPFFGLEPHFQGQKIPSLDRILGEVHREHQTAIQGKGKALR